MAGKKYKERRKKRFEEGGEEGVIEERERIEKQKKVLQQRKRTQREESKKMKAILMEKETLEHETQKKAKEAISSVRKAVEEVEETTEVSLYVPEIKRKISEMLRDTEKSFELADYEAAINLSNEIEELVEKVKLRVLRKTEEHIKDGKEAGKYFYCVIPSSEETSFGNIGMNNREVYTIPYRDVAAVVSDAHMKEYELTEEKTRNHEAVLRHAMEKHTVIPVEFGTTIKNKRILRRLLTKAYSPTRDSLRLVDNTVELGVKAILTGGTMLVAPEKRKDCVSDILASLNTRAKQAVTRDLFSDRLILNASFLVNKEDIDAFSDKVTELQEKYPMLKLLYSGPWAPYNFVYIKIGAEGVEISKNR